MESSRRSDHLRTHDSNGRDYLADQIDLTREALEGWMASSSVRPHLQLWHQICIGSPRRFNDAVKWINNGPDGYYYNAQRLEKDLLVLCLSEGKVTGRGKAKRLSSGPVTFTSTNVKTSSWVTQKLWARAAWRIVNDNKSEGQLFAKSAVNPGTYYSFTIDVLCLAFHSIAFRGQASPYEVLINGGDYSASTKPTPERERFQSPTQTTDDSTRNENEDTSSTDSDEFDRSSNAGDDDVDTDATSEDSVEVFDSEDCDGEIFVESKGVVKML